MNEPKKAYLGLRISKELDRKISKLATLEGKSKSGIVIAQLEQVLLQESFNKHEVIEAINSLKQEIKNFNKIKSSHSGSANLQNTIPSEILKKLIFSSTFSEYILQILNDKVNQNPSEIGQIALQARRHALAETEILTNRIKLK